MGCGWLGTATVRAAATEALDDSGGGTNSLSGMARQLHPNSVTPRRQRAEEPEQGKSASYGLDNCGNGTGFGCTVLG